MPEKLEPEIKQEERQLREVEPTVENLETKKPRTFVVETQEGRGWFTPHGVGVMERGKIIGHDQEGAEVREYSIEVADFGVPATVIINRNHVNEYGEVSESLIGTTLLGGKGIPMDEVPEDVWRQAEALRSLLELSSTHLSGEAQEKALATIHSSDLRILEHPETN